MKQILILLFILTAPVANAREPRFGGEASIGTAFPLDKPSVPPFSFQATGYYQISGRFSAGAGTGIILYETPLIPVYGSMRFLLTRPRRFTPYLACNIGYAFAPARDANGGIFLDPGIGVQYALKGSRRLFLAVGYEMLRLERLKAYSGDYFQASYREQLRHNAVCVKIGFGF